MDLIWILGYIVALFIILPLVVYIIARVSSLGVLRSMKQMRECSREERKNGI
jgi:hypothetical protein